MAYSLYIDTSSHLIIGLLDSDYLWLEYMEEENYKNSSKLHSKIFEILENKKINIKDIETLFRISGPGSYTGLRLTEGLSQIFEWKNLKNFSFNHFQIPSILGVEKGRWISKAYKKEIFVYSWSNDSSEKILIPENEISLELEHTYTHFNGQFPQDFTETSQMIKDQPQELFPFIVENNVQESTFYYRDIEVEFKPSLK